MGVLQEDAIYYSRITSPVGPLIVGATKRGLFCLEFDSPGALLYRTRNNGHSWTFSEQKTAAFVRELREYFEGKRTRFSFALDLHGTPFQKLCWKALTQIPYGKTTTYAAIAKRVGRPKAFRAVGQANHCNPLAIVVPCHRVLQADGSLGGYGGGLDKKVALLRLEGAIVN
jgi:O-6-methylguanine DNA methyltransferase